MKAIRRSMKGGEKDTRPNHISITPKSAIAIVPPKKVIKALYDYTPSAENPQELKFEKGDFFHVISRENDQDWYEACNPLYPNARGLVPVSFFEVIGKQERQSAGSSGSLEAVKIEGHDSGFSDRSSHRRTDSTTNTMSKSATQSMRVSGIKGSGAMVYGIVIYDFNAERPDELDAKAGEAIIVIAQSNPEWFVAKPIGRLGGPGLIPVSFIELRDMSSGQAVTDPLDAVRRAGVPKVEEWKKMTADYKNSSISLGKFDAGMGAQQMAAGMDKMSLNGSAPNGSGYGQSQAQPQQGYHQRNGSRAQSQQQFQPPQPERLAPISASIPRYCFDQDRYWYIIEAQMEDGSLWELSRFYHDFYDFQIALLQAFEDEAGARQQPRTLPYMPGPVTHVTDAISNGRRQSLDEYIKQLLSMPPHISRCSLIRELFAPRPGDFEIDPNAPAPALDDDYRLSHASQQSSGHELSQTESRQSSRGNMDNSQGGYPPQQMQNAQYAGHQRNQASLSASTGGSPYHTMNRQGSSLTQASVASASTSAPPPSAGAMKIKVYCQDDLIAIRVPSDISFQQLKEKLRDRLKAEDDIMIQYKDEPTGAYAELLSDNDLDVAIQRNPKLTLYVNLM